MEQGRSFSGKQGQSSRPKRNYVLIRLTMARNFTLVATSFLFSSKIPKSGIANLQSQNLL